MILSYTVYMNMNLSKKTTLTHCPHIHVWRKVKLCKIARHEIVKKKNPPHPLKTHRKLNIVFLPCFLLSLVKALYRERLQVCTSYKVLTSCWRGVFLCRATLERLNYFFESQSAWYQCFSRLSWAPRSFGSPCRKNSNQYWHIETLIDF